MLEETGHRPWPIPERPWVMGQTWDDLLFAHWSVPAEALRPLVPSGLELDRFEGQTWLGITPLRISGLRLRGLLPLPLVSSFPELNVRTYVSAGGKPGIWFFSLDSSNPVAVEAARRMYRLPYFRARITVERRGSWLDFSSARQGSERPFALTVRYRSVGEATPPKRGSLEEFLTERYSLYAADGERLLRAEIHHPPWPLERAEAEIDLNTMAPDPLELPDDEPLLHFSPRQDVVIWPLEELT